MSEDKLTRDDLVLLMESYRNMITMHQTILDQTSKTIEKMDNIATKQDSLFSKQGKICSSLNDINGNMDQVSKDLSTVTDKMNSHENKSIEQYGKVVNKIHLGWIGMGSIIIGLIGLVIALMNFIQTTPVP